MAQRAYTEEIQHGVALIRRHYSDIRRFIDKHGACASFFFHSATMLDHDDLAMDNPGIQDAIALVRIVGLENARFARAVILAHTGLQ